MFFNDLDLRSIVFTIIYWFQVISPLNPLRTWNLYTLFPFLCLENPPQKILTLRSLFFFLHFPDQIKSRERARLQFIFSSLSFQDSLKWKERKGIEPPRIWTTPKKPFFLTFLWLFQSSFRLMSLSFWDVLKKTMVDGRSSSKVKGKEESRK